MHKSGTKNENVWEVGDDKHTWFWGKDTNILLVYASGHDDFNTSPKTFPNDHPL